MSKLIGTFTDDAGRSMATSMVRRFCGLALALPLALCQLASGQTIIDVRADHVVGDVPRLLTGACIEDVNHEVYGGIYSQMIFGESFQEPAPARSAQQVSGMWRPIARGTAIGRYALIGAGEPNGNRQKNRDGSDLPPRWGLERPFIGAQSQQMVFESGQGEIGIENQGLNRWGMNFAAGREYEGFLWARVGNPVTLFVVLESRDGSRTYAEQSAKLRTGDWQRLEFTLTPDANDKHGRFALKLKQPGAVTLGYVFLQPGAWGRFKGLPVRRDVAEAMIGQGITVLRYGGSMVNSPGYRWKNMIGPRDRRPPYAGTWYRYSSNGWGIPDFMSFCEHAQFEYVPAFNMGQTPQDMADFIDYAKGSVESEWGRKRAADGHPTPYRLHYMELGNEERVDEKYATAFEALVAAIWAKDPRMVLVVGDFLYKKPIADPFHFSGAASGITTLAAHQRILRFAKQHDGEVWFDVHVDTDHPVPVNASLNGMLSFATALDKIAHGARHRVVVFEFNAGNHSQKRALANALGLNAIERDARIPIVTSANALQPDGQNDNGWNQGLLFLDPWHVWLQPPGYVTQMYSASYQPQRVQCDVSDGGPLDATATRSQDGKTLVLQVVNPADYEMRAQIRVAGYAPTKPSAQVTELAGPPEAANTADHPDVIVPTGRRWDHDLANGIATYTFPAHSVTVIRFE